MTRGDLHQRAISEGHIPLANCGYVTWLEDIILKYIRAESGTSAYHMECLCGEKHVTPEKVWVCPSCGRENRVL